MHAANRPPRCFRSDGNAEWLAGLAAVALAVLPALPARAQVSTTPTRDTDVLAAALQPTGLSINDVFIHNGLPGQFGTYTNFELRPVTIRPGVALSSGDVFNLAPFPEAQDPNYDPASPPPQVNNQMNAEPNKGNTPEFDLFGFTGETSRISRVPTTWPHCV